MLLELRRTTSVNKQRKTIRHANLNDTNTSANVTARVYNVIQFTIAIIEFTRE